VIGTKWVFEVKRCGGVRRVAGDVVTAEPGLSAQSVSLIVLFNAAADQIVAARGIAPTDPVVLIGAIGRAALAGLMPPSIHARDSASSGRSPPANAAGCGRNFVTVRLSASAGTKSAISASTRATPSSRRLSTSSGRAAAAAV
jgi:hypothetical protein